MGGQRAAGRPVPLTHGPTFGEPHSMPIYDYRCAGCGAQFEQLVRRDQEVTLSPLLGCQISSVSSHFRLAPLPAAASRTTVASGRRPAVAAAEVAANRTRINPAACPPPQSLKNHPAGEDDDPSLIWAAVAVVLAPDPDAILLIRRAERTGDPWSGHIALPGGRREPADPDLVATAIRETGEEVGIALEPERPGGSLRDVVPRTPALPPIAVRPFVFILPARPARHSQRRGGLGSLGDHRPPASTRTLTTLCGSRSPGQAARSKPTNWRTASSGG